MKTLTKRMTIAGLGAVCVLSLAAGTAVLANRSALAEAAASKPTATYYYDNLTDAEGKEYTLAKKFYDELEGLNAKGDFKDGVVEVDLVNKNILTSAQVKAWVEDGDLTVPKAFSAARDSFYYDHPELFYIDFYKLTLSAGKTDGNYVAYIDCGREANCYIDGGFKSEAEVNAAITDFNAEVKAAADYAKAETAKFPYEIAEEVLLARYANEYVAKNVAYDTEAYELATDSDTGYAKPYTGTAYGALKLRESVCNGYARAYKAVLDTLDIPCIIVSGSSLQKSSDGNSSIEKAVAHSWNYVWFADPATEGEIAPASSYAARVSDEKGQWYAYDVTWNSSSANKMYYIDMGTVAVSKNHVTDPVVSTSGYEMPYPAVADRSYGVTTDSDGISHSTNYVPYTDGSLDDEGNPLVEVWETVSYNGKGAVKLYEEDGLRLVYRMAYHYDGEVMWTNWEDLYADVYGPFGEGNKWGNFEGFLDSGTETKIYCNTEVFYTQYAVVEGVEPDLSNGLDDYKFQYNPENEMGDYITAVTEVFTNNSYGTYTAPPYVTATNPRQTGVITISDGMQDPATGLVADNRALTFEVTYGEELHLLSDGPIKVSFTAPYSNIDKYARVITLDDKGNQAELLEDKHTLRFKFAPSLMYEHNSALYSFYFTNVGSNRIITKLDGTSKTSDKLPNPVHYHFARGYMACPQVFGDGRLWVDCCAQPTLVSNSDLAAMDFKDEDGNSTFSESARSQMMLVVESVSAADETAMLNEIKDQQGVTSGNNNEKGTIATSETYDIALQICGKYPTIPNGSYVKIALGFPEGYGPEDEGVTFKLYHRKHVGNGVYVIEDVPCVVTKLGIVATVTSFSPYMVAVLNGAPTEKTIYATVDGKGGTILKEEGEVKKLASEQDTVTYTMNPAEGYKLYKVTLNGVDVTSKVNANKLTLTYAELAANNEVEIQYITDAAAARFEQKNIVEAKKVYVEAGAQPSTPSTPSEPETPVQPSEPSTPSTPSEPSNPSTPTTPTTPSTPEGDNPGDEAGVGTETGPKETDHTAITVICVVIGVLVIANAVAIVVIVKRRKSRE